jgi:glucose-6-phosphate isomerase
LPRDAFDRSGRQAVHPRDRGNRRPGHQAHIGDAGADKALDYLVNQTMGDLLKAEADAVAAAMARQGRPVRLIGIPTVDERVMGALMMHFMLETMFAAELWSVDAFDQPEVEASRVLTRQYLSRRQKP